MLNHIFNKKKKINELRNPTIHQLSRFQDALVKHANKHQIAIPPCYEKAIFRAIAGQKDVQNVDFRNENLTDSDIIILAQAIIDMPIISHICLKSNKITDMGAKALIEVLRQQIILAKTGQRMSASGSSDNLRGDAGFSPPNYLRYLISINLKSNNIAPSFLQEIAQCLQVLEPEEKRQEIRVALRHFDRNAQGGLDEEDFKAVLRLLTGVECGKKELKILMDQIMLCNDTKQIEASLENLLLAKCSSSPAKNAACPPWQALVSEQYTKLGLDPQYSVATSKSTKPISLIISTESRTKCNLTSTCEVVNAERAEDQDNCANVFDVAMSELTETGQVVILNNIPVSEAKIPCILEDNLFLGIQPEHEDKQTTAKCIPTPFLSNQFNKLEKKCEKPDITPGSGYVSAEEFIIDGDVHHGEDSTYKCDFSPSESLHFTTSSAEQGPQPSPIAQPELLNESANEPTDAQCNLQQDENIVLQMYENNLQVQESEGRARNSEMNDTDFYNDDLANSPLFTKGIGNEEENDEIPECNALKLELPTNSEEQYGSPQEPFTDENSIGIIPIDSIVSEIQMGGRQVNAAKYLHPDFKSGLILQDFPEDVPFGNLYALILSGNELKNLSLFEGCMFRHTILLDISDNQLSALQDVDMAIFPKLQVLDLSANRFKSIHGLTKLFYLRGLNFGKNLLKNVMNLEHMSELEILNLHGNKIHNVASFRSLSLNPKLQHLNLDANPILNTSHRQRQRHIVNTLNVLPALQSLGSVSVTSLSSKSKRRPQLSELNSNQQLEVFNDPLIANAMKNSWLPLACEVLKIYQDSQCENSRYHDTKSLGRFSKDTLDKTADSDTRKYRVTREEQLAKDEQRARAVACRSRNKAPPSPTRDRLPPYCFGPPPKKFQRRKAKSTSNSSKEAIEKQKSSIRQLSMPRRAPINQKMMQEALKQKSRAFNTNMSVAERIDYEQHLAQISKTQTSIQLKKRSEVLHKSRREMEQIVTEDSGAITSANNRLLLATSPLTMTANTMPCRIESMPSVESPKSRSDLLRNQGTENHIQKHRLDPHSELYTRADIDMDVKPCANSSNSPSVFLQSLAVSEFLMHVDEEYDTSVTALNVLMTMSEKENPDGGKKLEEYRRSLSALGILEEQESDILFAKAKDYETNNECSIAFEKLRSIKKSIRMLLWKLEEFHPGSKDIREFCQTLRKAEAPTKNFNSILANANARAAGKADASSTKPEIDISLNLDMSINASVIKSKQLKSGIVAQTVKVIEDKYKSLYRDRVTTSEEIEDNEQNEYTKAATTETGKSLVDFVFPSVGRLEEKDLSVVSNSIVSERIPELDESGLLSSNDVSFEEEIDFCCALDDIFDNSPSQVRSSDQQPENITGNESLVLEDANMRPPNTAEFVNSASLPLVSETQHTNSQEIPNYLDIGNSEVELFGSASVATNPGNLDHNTDTFHSRSNSQFFDPESAECNSSNTIEQKQSCENLNNIHPDVAKNASLGIKNNLEPDIVQRLGECTPILPAETIEYDAYQPRDTAQVQEGMENEGYASEEIVETEDEDDEEGEIYNNWEKGFDPNTHCYYWYNHATGESSWTPPEGWPYELDTPFEDEGEVLVEQSSAVHQESMEDRRSSRHSSTTNDSELHFSDTDLPGF